MGNTEGSRAVFPLTQEEKDILIGCILGDAYIYPKGKICIEHGIKQYEYIVWLQQRLHRISYPKLAKVVRFNQKIQRETVSYRFFLRQWFRSYREQCLYK